MSTTATYNPLTSQNLAYVIRVDTRDTRRYLAAPRPSPPLQGLRGTHPAADFYQASVPAGHGSHGVAPSYRALAPHGAGLASGIEGHRSDAARPTANYSLLTANSSYTFSAKEKDSETGLSYFGSRYYSSDLSIWLSVDPMSDKYPSLSPYVYCADNPVRCVDPNGDTVIVTGPDADSYVQGLNTKNLTFSRDESGYVSYQGIAKTSLEKRLVSAINDPKIIVNICAENSTSIDNVGGAADNLQTAGGSFLGTVYEDGIVNTYQQVNPNTLKIITNDIGAEPGMYERHELTESYVAGKISLRRKFSSPMAGVTGSVYRRAHNRASFAYDVEFSKITVIVPVFKKNGLLDLFNTKSVTLYKYSIDYED